MFGIKTKKKHQNRWSTHTTQYTTYWNFLLTHHTITRCQLLVKSSKKRCLFLHQRRDQKRLFAVKLCFKAILCLQVCVNLSKTLKCFFYNSISGLLKFHRGIVNTLQVLVQHIFKCTIVLTKSNSWQSFCGFFLFVYHCLCI